MSWIRCYDRMPGLFDAVLIVKNPKPPVTQGASVEVACLSDSGYWYDIINDCNYEMETVKYWQPLPEPPKDGE